MCRMGAVKRARRPWPLIVVDERGIQGQTTGCCGVFELEELHTTTTDPVSFVFVFFRTRLG